MPSYDLEYTPVKSIAAIVQRCRDAATKQVLYPVERRKETLRAMLRMLHENEKALQDAVFADIGKNPAETQMMEISMLYTEIVYLLDHVDEWTKEVAAPTEGMNKLMNCTIRYDPLGCALIIGAYNYPVIIALSPAAGAICAGNTVVLKPSEIAPNTAKVLTDLLPRYIDPSLLGVVNGAIEETTELLQNSVFDHIFYTGSDTVGKIVMAAAARNLSRVALELGGKSPTIIDESCAADVEIVAARVLWGKYSNAGQTCVAPDYVLIHESLKDAFVAAFGKQRIAFMKGNPNIAEDLSYARLVSRRQYDRIAKMLDGSCGRIILGGEQDSEALKIGVTLLDDVKLDGPLMQAEIFGPLLPIITYRTRDEAIRFVQARAKPLALYVFSRDKAFVRRVKAETSSGAMVVNDLMLHVALSCLPFGGVGGSGMGSYHGWASFETFTHRKAILNDTLALEAVKSVRYPPYCAKKLSAFRRVMDPWGEKSGLRRAVERVITLSNLSCLMCFLAGAVAAHMYPRGKVFAS